MSQPGAAALTVQQDPSAEAVLQREALSRGAPTFTVVPPMSILDDVELGLSGHLAIRKINASLAIAVVNAFLSSPRITQAFLPYVETKERDFVAALRTRSINDASDLYTSRQYPGSYEHVLLLAIGSWIAFILTPYLLQMSRRLPELSLPPGITCSLAGIARQSLEMTVTRSWIMIAAAIMAGNLAVPFSCRPSKRVAATVVQESLTRSAFDPVDLPDAFYRGLAWLFYLFKN